MLACSSGVESFSTSDRPELTIEVVVGVLIQTTRFLLFSWRPGTPISPWPRHRSRVVGWVVAQHDITLTATLGKGCLRHRSAGCSSP